MRIRIVSLLVLLLACVSWGAEPPVGKLVRDLTGPDKRARATARQLLPRHGVSAVGELIPLLAQKDQVIAKAAFDILMDIGNEASAPGRGSERKRVTDRLMVLVGRDRPEAERIIGLQLLERLVPPGYDVGPIAAVLSEKPMLRDKARTALQRIGTPEARSALRRALGSGDPDFDCALLNALGELKNGESLDAIVHALKDPNPKVRAAAARALAWTGDPSHMKSVRRVIRTADEATRGEAMDAMVRLLNVMEARGGNWQIVVWGYCAILNRGGGVFKDAALAGLGRIGDGTCVAPMLAAIKEADARTRLVGMDALRRMQGVDVARAIVAAYPDLPAPTQIELLTVLGEKKTPIVLPVLQHAAGSEDAAFRLAALEALGGSGLAEGLSTLIDAAMTGSAEEKKVARDGMLAVAEVVRAKHHGSTAEAGRAYVAVLRLAGNDRAMKTRALNGLTGCPVPAAFGAVMDVANDESLKAPVTKALLAIGAKLVAVGQHERAQRAYDKVRQLGPDAETVRALIPRLQKLDPNLDLAGLLGIVTHWWIVGPFDLGKENENWKADLVNESKIDLAAAYPAGARDLPWKQVVTKSPQGVVNLINELAAAERCVAYAYAEIEVDKEMPAVLRIGSDDGVRAWVNGERVWDNWADRGLTVDQDQPPVTLQAGKNTLLLKIQQGGGGWAFCLRVTTPDGPPVGFTQRTK